MNNLIRYQSKPSVRSILLFEEEGQDRNKNISPVIVNIQDNGPALLKANSEGPKPGITRKPLPTEASILIEAKAPINNSTQDDHIQQITTTSYNANFKRESRINLRVIFIIILILSGSAYYAGSLNTRINILEQQLINDVRQ